MMPQGLLISGAQDGTLAAWRPGGLAAGRVSEELLPMALAANPSMGTGSVVAAQVRRSSVARFQCIQSFGQMVCCWWMH